MNPVKVIVIRHVLLAAIVVVSLVLNLVPKNVRDPATHIVLTLAQTHAAIIAKAAVIVDAKAIVKKHVLEVVLMPALMLVRSHA